MRLAEIPALAEREWLIDELATLIARCGRAPFTVAPIIEPTNEFFPDAWTPDAAGVERLARRLLGYAGLSGVEIGVVGGAVGPGGDAIWIEHCDGRTCQLGVGLDQLGEDPAGRMAIIAAAIYRAAGGLAPVEPGGESVYRRQSTLEDEPPRPRTRRPRARAIALESKRVEATAIYLGFAALAANHCFRHEYAVGRSRYVVTRPRLTALEPQTFAYGLAVQSAVRGLGFLDRRRLAGQLDPNPAGFFEASRRLIEDDAEGLAERLGLKCQP